MNKLPDQNCKDCPNGNKCSEIYSKLGESGCKPVTIPVSIAFLLPMVVFIVSVVVFSEYCSGGFENKTNASSISLLVGVFTAGLSVYVARLIYSRKRVNKEFVEKDIK